jgi:DNA-binding LacI/PurR family transcriptional regulator
VALLLGHTAANGDRRARYAHPRRRAAGGARARACRADRPVGALGGDTDLANVHTPAITALRWSLEDTGRAAAELLLQRLHGDAAQAQTRALLPVDLVLRDSCAAPGPA